MLLFYENRPCYELHLPASLAATGQRRKKIAASELAYGRPLLNGGLRTLSRSGP